MLLYYVVYSSRTIYSIKFIDVEQRLSGAQVLFGDLLSEAVKDGNQKK